VFQCSSCPLYSWSEFRKRVEGRSSGGNPGATAHAKRKPPQEDAPEPEPLRPTWPDPIQEDGFHGIAGELVRAIEPHSEADPAALLVQALVGWRSLLGRGPYYLAEADHHHGNEYLGIVGTTAKARKGTSWGRILHPLKEIDDAWAENCQVLGSRAARR
jgi:hypothetical protein